MHVLYNYLIPILSILGLPLDRRSIDIALFRGTCVISANKGNREYGGWVGVGGRKHFQKEGHFGEHERSLRYWYLWAYFGANFFIAPFYWVVGDVVFLGLLEFIGGCCRLFGLGVHLLQSDQIYCVYGIF